MESPQPGPITYEITVAGEVPEEMLATFPGIDPQRSGTETVLRASLANRAALHSLLAVIDLFELDLIEVRRVD